MTTKWMTFSYSQTSNKDAHMIKAGVHWADVSFLLILLTVFATLVDARFYIELPLVLVAAFAWTRGRKWLGVGRIVREDTARRKQDDSGRRDGDAE
jgi:hypothetical protein